VDWQAAGGPSYWNKALLPAAELAYSKGLAGDELLVIDAYNNQ
jgi:hypothetical protein